MSAFGHRKYARPLNNALRPSSKYCIDRRSTGYVAVRHVSNEGVFSFSVLSYGLIAFLAFKVILLLALNPDAYNLRVQLLAEGTVLEKFGARLLDIDPITQFFSQMVLYFF